MREVAAMLAVLSLVGCKKDDDTDKDGTSDATSEETSECLSGYKWIGGDEDAPTMRPGHQCLECHKEEGAPEYAFAGTIYSGPIEADDCFGEEGATIRLVDDNGDTWEATSNEAGNFYLGLSNNPVAYPATAYVISGGVESKMNDEVYQGECNKCHDATLRLMVPSSEGLSEESVDCLSGYKWIGEDYGAAEMRPGEECIACHKTEGAAALSVAGTVYEGTDEPDDCFGKAGVTVKVVDANSNSYETTTNNAGNFYFTEALSPVVFPATVSVVHGADESAMVSEVADGDCNSCHDVDLRVVTPRTLFEDSGDCLSGYKWIGGERPSAKMKPGGTCISCHEDQGAPEYSIAGTIFDSTSQANDCYGLSGVTIKVVDDNGLSYETTANEAGNFYLLQADAPVVFPATVSLTDGIDEVFMVTDLVVGDCNGCHNANSRIVGP